MVEKGRVDTHQESNTIERISEIVGFYSKDYEKTEGHKVEIYTAIVDALSRIDVEKKWTWKYLSNVERKHIKPGKRFSAAINILHRIILQKPIYAQAPVCMKCGEVHEVPWCTKEYGEPKKPQKRKYTPPWFRVAENYPDQERMEKVLNGWVIK